MKKKLKIKVSIADRVYPLTIDPAEEEGFRRSVKKINALIKRFEQDYAVRDKQDVLAMCALQFSSELEVKSVYSDTEYEIVKQKIGAIHTMLDNASE